MAALFFGGNQERARALLKSPRSVPKTLSKSPLNRRLHRIAPLFQVCFARPAEMWKQRNESSAYIINTFPLPTLDNVRVWRARLYRGEVLRGYVPSKRRYFDGLRLGLLTTSTGQPVEAFLAPGSMNDTEAVKHFACDLRPGSIVEADRGCTGHLTGDLLRDALDVQLRRMRKKNSTRPVPPRVAFLQFHGRRMVEAAGSLPSQMLPRSIHAVSAPGFELKVFLVDYSIRCDLQAGTFGVRSYP